MEKELPTARLKEPLNLTIVTAVLDEAENLPGFLEHVTNIAKEVIIVVDYRNSDSSPSLARQYGCKVIEDRGESEGIVFNNKNRGISEAQYEWVMIMDADERMSSVLQTEVSQIVNGTYPTKSDLYQTSFINYEFGKLFTKCDQVKKPFVRLFRKGKFFYNTGRTAEGFGIQTQSINKSGLGSLILKIPLLRSYYLQLNPNITNLKGHLIHNSHPSIHDFVRKIDHYSTREARILNNSGKKVSLFHIIWWPKKEFVYKYFIWRFYREGVHGLIASTLYAFYWFLIATKLYAYQYQSENKSKIKSIEKKYNFPNLIDPAKE